VALAYLLMLIVMCSYLIGWKWTGLSKRTLWDRLELLIVPFVLAIGGYLSNSSQNQATEGATGGGQKTKGRKPTCIVCRPC
jgi:putative effector of murein hydrolase LrgA (UPF0299 family)